MSNPFDEDAQAAAADEEGLEPENTEGSDEGVEGSEVAEPDADVDVDSAEETDETDEPDDKPAGVVKKRSPSGATSRPPVPEGYVSPVAAAKKLSEVLTARAREAGQLEDDEIIEVRPQVVYSYIRNSQGGKYPIPVYEVGGRSNLLKLDEFIAWWDEKDKRVAERKANATKKAAKKAAKAKEAPVEEAEGSEPEGEAVEAE